VTKRSRIAAIAIALLLLSGIASAQLDEAAEQEGAKPWEGWRPPAVEMPEPNAFELYELAWALRQELDEQAGGGDDPGFGRADELTADELSALCGQYEPVFRLLEEAVAGEAQFPLFEDPAQQMPYFARIREAARMFAARSLLRRGEGRPLEAALDAIACLHLGADAMTQGTLISGLVSIACQAIGQRQLEAVIPDLEAVGARAAMLALRRAQADTASFAEVLRGEETYVRMNAIPIFPQFAEAHELAERLRDDPDLARQVIPEAADLEGEALETEIEEGIAQLRAWDPANMWAEIGSYFGAILAEAEKPWWARTEPEEPGNVLLANLSPAFKVAGLKFAVMDARLSVVLAALAARAHLGEHESLPTSLDALAPDYLPEVPSDPFADAPLRVAYGEPVTRAHPASAREPAGARVLVIYSVGPDGDDDGGEDIGRSIDADSDGDIALVLTAE